MEKQFCTLVMPDLSPHRPHFHRFFRYEYRLRISQIKPEMSQAYRLLVLGSMDSPARSFWAEHWFLILLNREHMLQSHIRGCKTGYLFVLVHISTSLFPAGGEASNVKEYDGLFFFHACWRHTSTFSLGNM